MNDKFIRYALDNSAIVAMTDSKGTITFVNQKFCEISGYGEKELIGFNHRILRSGIHHNEFFLQMYRTISSGHIWHGEICNRKKMAPSIGLIPQLFLTSLNQELAWLMVM